jgi:XTP/dITP diphosphohydrolase
MLKHNEPIIITTSNPGKLSEMKKFAERHSKIPFLGLSDINAPELSIPETDTTYLGNAKLKADAYYKLLNRPVLADDSGIEVKALGWEPGVFSARYAGEDATSEMNNMKLLQKLEGIEDRAAKLVCTLCLKISEGVYIVTVGEIEGEIVSEVTSKEGWGYEPLFYLNKFLATLGQVKQSRIVGHRVEALGNLIKAINQ